MKIWNTIAIKQKFLWSSEMQSMELENNDGIL